MEQWCYLCGEKLIKNKNKTKDHVPPECIFPKNKPPNLITLPCCNNCNQSFQPLDEKMRNIFAILAIKNSGEVGQVARKEVLKSRKLSAEFLYHTKKHPTLLYENGNPCLEFFFNEDELNLWLKRVVKGLYYHHNNSRIKDNAIYNIKKYPQLEPPQSNTLPLKEGLKFRPYFIYGIIKEPNNDFWVLCFYDYLIFSVSVNIPS